ncbi:hypothetical protein ACFL1G_01895 [Planctomycetota bacterium]
MSEQRTGLHKDIASIFDGVSAKDKEQQESYEVPASEQSGGVPGELLTPSHLKAEPPQQPEPVEEHPEPPEQPEPKPVEEQPELVEEQTEPLIKLPEAAPLEKTKVKTAAKPAYPSPARKSKIEQIKAKLFAPKSGVSEPKQKVMAVLILVLFVVLIVVLTQVMKGPAGKRNKTTKPAGSIAATTTAGAEFDWQRPEPYPETLRNPMQSTSMVSVQPESKDKIIIKGILYSKDRPSAIISDKIVYEGDEIMGAIIVKITEDGIEFEKDGEEWTQKVQR